MMKKSCRNALKETLDIYESALEYRLAADEMMENIDQFWEDDDGERMRKASNAYDDSILTLADAIRFALVTPDEYDVSLRARTERINTRCRQLGKLNVCLVSIHTNAAGNGKQWMNVRGWTCYTSKGQTAGDRLADCLYQAAALWLPGHKLRKDYSDGDPDWESDFYILKNTLCAAALTENLFHDNSDDCLFLESDEGRRAIVALHVEGIVNYVLRRY